MAKFNLIKAFASELLDAKNVISFETGTIQIGCKYYQAIKVAFHNGEGEIMKQIYIFDNVLDWSDMIDELLFLTPVWTKDAFVEKHNIQYTPYNKKIES